MLPMLLPYVGAAAFAGELAVGNEALRRELAVDPQRGLVSTRLVDGDGAVTLAGEEFRIRLADGRELAPSTLPLATLHPLPEELGTRGALARYRSEGDPHVVEVAWLAPTNVPWLRKQVRLATARDGERVEWIAIERFALPGGAFAGGGTGMAARADNGLLLVPDHPGLECAVAGGSVVVRDHFAADTAPAAWSDSVTVALDRRGTLLRELTESYAGSESVSATPDAAWRLEESDLVSEGDGQRTLPAEPLRAAAAPIAAALREAAGEAERVVLLTPRAWLDSGRWFASTLAPGAIARALKELRAPPTAVALTVPFAARDGVPLPLATGEELRAARKALVALLQADGSIVAPRWFVDLLPASLPSDAPSATALVERWIALLATQRRLAPEARLALVSDAPLAPSWRRFADRLACGTDEQALLAPWPAASDRGTLATELSERDGARQPLLAFSRDASAAGAAQSLADAASAHAFWRTAPTGDDAPQWRRNPGFVSAPYELPARAGGWLRLLPWRELMGGDGERAVTGELGAGETALFIPLRAAGAVGALPRGARFEFPVNGGPPTILLAPGETRAITWVDAGDGRELGRGQTGLAPAFQRRSHGEPLAISRKELARDPGGLRLVLAGSTPIFREEELVILVECDGVAATALRLSAAPPSEIAVTGDAADTRVARFAVTLPESRAPPQVELRLDGDLTDVTALRIVAQLHETLTAVPTRPPATAGRPPRTLPPAPLAARRTSTVILHDGPLPAPSVAAPAVVESASVETKEQRQ
jgi:hypothetical protein